MMTRIERLSFLVVVYTKSLFAHKQLIICALLSGLCCLAVLLGAAIVFSPNDQYQHFANELYCQWILDEPIDFALIADQLAFDTSNEYISQIHVITKAHSDNGPILVYGLSDSVLLTKNNIMYGSANSSPKHPQCYIDQAFIPYEYDINMDELIVRINGIDFDCVGKSFLLPYNFPPSVISQIGYDEKLSISCRQNEHMRTYNNADILYENLNEQSEQHIRAVYVPLEFLAEQHTHICAIAITMNEPLTESARVEFESKYRMLSFKTFSHPTLSNWSQLIHEMIDETVKEMWAVEIVMFVCMLNQLVFWEILMRKIKPVIKRCRMVGGSSRILKSSLTVLIVLIAIMIILLAVPLYLLGIRCGGIQISLSTLGTVSASIIWIVGLVGYCLLVVRTRKTKGWWK